MEMFERATREKFRFKLSNGIVSVEDLWDLKLDDPRLDQLAISLNKEIKELTEESFIKTKTKKDETLNLKFELVKYIINTKLKEKEERELTNIKLQKKAKLEELIYQKELEEISSKTLEELKKEYNELD